jgi:hypothetical protein
VYPKYKRVLLVSEDKGTLVGGSDKPSKQIDPKAWVVRFFDFGLALQSEQALPVFKESGGAIQLVDLRCDNTRDCRFKSCPDYTFRLISE